METKKYPTWLVSIGIAKNLKKIGFDTPCTFVCTSSDRIGFTLGNGEGNYHYFEEIDEENHNGRGLLSLPTWEQVLEWFREKGLFGYVDKLTFVKDGGVCNRFCVKGVNFLVAGSFNSYEEAREALIDKLIEIYKK